jgi:hypothetical protein
MVLLKPSDAFPTLTIDTLPVGHSADAGCRGRYPAGSCTHGGETWSPPDSSSAPAARS